MTRMATILHVINLTWHLQADYCSRWAAVVQDIESVDD